MENQPKLLEDHAELQAHQGPSLVSHFEGSYASGRNFPVKHDGVQVPKRTRFPFLPRTNEVVHEYSHFPQNDYKSYIS